MSVLVMKALELQRFFEREPEEVLSDPEAPLAHEALLAALEAGQVRAAERGEDGVWRANAWVKRAILAGFRRTGLIQMEGPGFPMFDKSAYPPRQFTIEDNVRLVPGGNAVRRGAYLAKGVVVMPPAYINVGAYVDTGTMVDSHALVGSCAQIGARVHLSAGAQIGGVLEPVGAAPVVIEDGVFVGGGCGVYEGTVVRAGAVLAAGVVLTRGSRVYDLTTETVLRAEGGRPLEIPAGAVVVPGARAVTSEFGRAHGLSVSAPVIVKVRDASTDAATTLEDALR